MVKLEALKPGEWLYVTIDNSCMKKGEHKFVYKDYQGLFVCCSQGKHYLDGAEGDDGTLIGFEYAG